MLMSHEDFFNIQINTYICNDENNTFSTYSNNSKTPYPEEFVIELWSEEFGIVKRIESNSYTLESCFRHFFGVKFFIR